MMDFPAGRRSATTLIKLPIAVPKIKKKSNHRIIIAVATFIT